MSKKFDNSLIIELKASLFLSSVLLFVGLGAVLLLLPLTLPYGGRLWLGAVVLVALARMLCLHALGCAPQAIRRIKLMSSGACALAAGASPWRDGEVTGWFVHPWLVILRLRHTAMGRPRTVLVAWDALPAESFRRLRVWANGLRRPMEG